MRDYDETAAAYEAAKEAFAAIYVLDDEPVPVPPRYYCPNTLAMAMITPPKIRAPKHKRRKGKR